ncbi:hypothetical protein AGMMS4956_07830 [Bacteroidia bacterium]|nr:hypothetical protein AGMMS4956_07830 [Bacteroidia bacterium]
MNLKILSPTATLYEGAVQYVVLPGAKGAFEVLPDHAPIISSLQRGAIRYATAKDTETTVDIQSGFVEVNNNQITVCIEVS